MALLTRNDGIVARTPEEAADAEAAGYKRCYGTMGRGVACPLHISPQAVASIQQNAGGYYTCPICLQSYDLLEDMPWHGVDAQEAEHNQRADQARQGWKSGGGTRIGLPMTDQAQIGEDLVHNLGELPGYGKITWWHEGGAAIPSPLDGATEEWGIEVKTLGYDAAHHRFVPGGVRRTNGVITRDEKAEKNQQAAEMGKKGILGILVLLDYRRSVADVYAKAMPLEPWTDPKNPNKRINRGVTAFRSNSAEHLLVEVPFRNPLMDPTHPSPVVAPRKTEEEWGF